MDNAAPGGLVVSAPRLLAEVEHLARVLGSADGLAVIAEAARLSMRSGAALVTAYV
ncbi:hypothetical protein [Phytomonospora endophytica]|uniref:Uncharacterized protein n=1 Tax=Phytomonospora endophytica TaxID=714109 RepID=A0A841FIV2_9ACTN|nr:hypothetical protein [Phytomonospora endophytica]MBB6033077.1 hypothetical protein [Phytomonospora endophytica]GIG65304.1 hypothetical protein Pen01_15990 [Phytomonospora endophytica]